MQLTPCQYNTFIYLIAFIREILKHISKNQLKSVQLILVFSSCLMHSDMEGITNGSSRAASTSVVNGKDKPKAWVILKHFITSDEFC
jgi:hypothetical protein